MAPFAYVQLMCHSFSILIVAKINVILKINLLFKHLYEMFEKYALKISLFDIVLAIKFLYRN